MNAHFPTGTITFLFTDIEGSTKLWQRHPEAMQSALAQHDALLRNEIQAQGGSVFKTVGDAFCAAFPTASGGLSAALSVQRPSSRSPATFRSKYAWLYTLAWPRSGTAITSGRR